jgi:hypothetical protein
MLSVTFDRFPHFKSISVSCPSIIIVWHNDEPPFFEKTVYPLFLSLLYLPIHHMSNRRLHAHHSRLPYPSRIRPVQQHTSRARVPRLLVIRPRQG